MTISLNNQATHNLPALVRLGGQITARRKALKIRAQSCAGAAGISRVTLHRIERGESTVNMGAYLQVCKALDLHLGLVPLGNQEIEECAKKITGPDTPHLRIKDYPQLKTLAWQLDEETYLTDAEAISIYERNKRFLDLEHLENHERELMQRLTVSRGMERLFV